MNPNFVKPRYDHGGFASLPKRIQQIFEKEQAKTLLFFFLDGFGWRFYQQFKDHPFFVELAKYSSVEKITSQFPSTTAAHVTTWHTGLPVGESGVFEWNYYEPKLDAIFSPLLFSYAGTLERETAKESGIPPAALYPNENIYSALNDLGVDAHIFQHKEFSDSPYSNVLMEGLTRHPYKTISEAMTNLHLMLNEPAGKRYIAFYFGDVDSIMHTYGPSSPQAKAEIESLLDTLLRQFLLPLTKEMPGETMLLLTADHGHMEVDPETCIYLNRDPALSELEPYLKRDQAGHPLVPAGSPRDFFLYIKDESLNKALALLAHRFEGIADVVTTQELIDADYFGPKISETFLSRVGNLVILPYREQSVWWYVEGKFEQWHYGHHGGLSPEEMEIPLFTANF